MKIEDVKSPSELMKYMDEHIQYGFVANKDIYTVDNDERFEEGCETLWRLSSPEELIKNGYGHYWDQVEFERDWFLKNGYTVKTLYIMFEMDHENPYTTHTYLIFEKDDKFCLFEHSDFPNKGIYEFDTYKDAVYYQMENHIKMNNKIKPLTKDVLECLHIYEYDQPPYGIDFYEFMDYIFDEGKKIL